MSGWGKSRRYSYCSISWTPVGLFYPYRTYAENTWTILREFGYQDVYSELGCLNSNVHRLQNVMTLKYSLRDLFDQLALWFEATVGRTRISISSRSQTVHNQGIPNSYKICSSLRRYHAAVRVPEYVEFITERQDLPLPSPRYLEIHVACCRIAHMSGVANFTAIWMTAILL